MNKASLASSAKTKVYGIVRNYFSIKYWPYFLAVFLFLILIFILYLVIKHYRKRSSEGGRISQGPKKEKISPYSLRRTWKRFLKELPREFRRSVLLFRQFIVLGEAGSGKSALIDNYTDWRGQARQFYPSYTIDSYLQIYMASKSLVQEIPAWILNDTSKAIRVALKKLWQPIFKKRDATVVIALSVKELLSKGFPESLKIQAQVIRGKINILSSIQKKKVRVYLVLTYMDEIDGYLEFCEFLSANAIPLEIEFDPENILKDLPNCLENYENWLPLALTTLPSEKYMKILSFLKEAPKLFPALEDFIRVLRATDPLSKKPDIVKLYFTSTKQKYFDVSNPFGALPTAKDQDDIKIIDPIRKHKIAAVVLSILAVVYFTGSFVYEHKQINKLFNQIKQVELAPRTGYDIRLHNIVQQVSTVNNSIIYNLLPDFFSDAKKSLKIRCINDIRDIYLIPKFISLRNEFNHLNKQQSLINNSQISNKNILYILALIYSNKDNDLGKLILANEKLWEKSLSIPSNLIFDYINNNQYNNIYNIPLNIQSITYYANTEISTNPYMLTVFFQKIKSLITSPMITQSQLNHIKYEAISYLTCIKEIKTHTFTNKLIKFLRQDAKLKINVIWGSKGNNIINQPDISKFLTVIKNTDLNYGQGFGDLSLYDFIEYLTALNNAPIPSLEKNKIFYFNLPGQSFQFCANDWFNLIKRSKIALCINKYITYNYNLDGMIFFGPGDNFSNIVMNPTNNGQYLFTGKGVIDGWFTKEAFNTRVKPVLMLLPKFLKSLYVAPSYKKSFSSFVYREVQAYASRYAEENANYINSFGIKADSVGSLYFVLDQLVLPSSPLTSMLLTVCNNTSLNIDSNNTYMSPFILSLGEFEWLWHLMKEQKGCYPELEKYKAIIAHLKMDITNKKSKKQNDQMVISKYPFKKLLTPIGKVSFDIYCNNPGSYLSITKNWLDSVGIGPKWQHIFLAPIYSAYNIGLRDISFVLNKLWSKLVKQDIEPLYSRFPFNTKSNLNVSFKQLKNATNINGDFWITFNSMLAPFVTKDQNGGWQQNNPSSGLKLPNNMCRLLNRLTRLQKILWDSKGNPSPITLFIEPQPLPKAIDDEPVVVLSYLRIGKESIFGFNQCPYWEKLNFKWWKSEPAFVGVQFASNGNSLKFKQLAFIPKSNWSLYHLLLTAEQTKPLLYSWQVYKHKTTKNPIMGKRFETETVRFKFKRDPWQIFKIK